MKLIYEPSVCVLARQVVDQGGLDAFLSANGVEWKSDSDVPAEVIAETAGRTCYMSFAKPRPGGNAAYLEHIKEVGHGSVLEHTGWTFLIEGVSRSLTHELVRHRAGMSYSQLSQRYVDESDVAFVVPPKLADDVKAAEDHWRARWGNPDFGLDEYLCIRAGRQEITESERIGIEWIHSVERSRQAYINTVKRLTARMSEDLGGGPNANNTAIRKAARQAARSVLPNCTETKIVVTANARALRHFLEQRGSRHADTEIRELANAILDVLLVESPNLFGDYNRTLLSDGTYEITTPYAKV